MKHLNSLWIAIPLLNTAQQFFLKHGAEGSEGAGLNWLSQVLSSPWFIGAVIAELACFILWMRVLSEHDLAKAFPLSAISYVFIMASAWLIFGETVSAASILGSILILAGVWFIATPGKGGKTTA
ncbi:EamA family transporter [Oryzifoliimicrobium ureilyticus]|uniref:EamA family transporter n=1 Tax=Oryzifoliimicrobium ureilyticus TaxID=3113724 RepID=UPI0030765863